MVVAEFEAFFSRPVAPTRRIAIGRLRLPEPREGRSATYAAAMLLGGVPATFARSLDEDDVAELHRLIDDVEHGRRIAQPRMRHRWALEVLKPATADGRPARREVQRAFRSALRDAHPDHGAPLDGAAARISELDTARRILLG